MTFLTTSLSAKAWLAIFLLPAASLPLLALAVLQRSGELTPLREIMRRQRPSEPLALYGPAYSDQKVLLKQATWIERAPRIAACGNSRVMQMRAGFFLQQDSFYNLGGLIGQVPDLRYWLAKIPQSRQPEVLIVGIEHSFFNRRWHNYPGGPRLRDEAPPALAIDLWEREWRSLVRDYFLGKFCLGELGGAQREIFIGLNALVHTNGFRNDGSYRYGRTLRYSNDFAAPHERFSEALRRVNTGGARYEPGQEVNLAAVEELAAFLNACRLRGIHVVGFLPPYAQVVLTELRRNPLRYAYVWKLPAQLAPLFQSNGFTFADFTDYSVVGGSDAEMLDGNHGSEKMYLRLLIALAETDSNLGRAVDLDHVRKLLSESTSNLEIFPDPL